jgi:hypothetical protein
MRPAIRIGRTDAHATRAAPVTSAQVWKAAAPGGPVLGGGEAVAAEVEEVADLVVGGEEALGLPGRLEPLSCPFSRAADAKCHRAFCLGCWL